MSDVSRFLVRAQIQSLLLVLGVLYLTVMAQKLLSKALLSEYPTVVSGFLSSLAQAPFPGSFHVFGCSPDRVKPNLAILLAR